jgi:hypothetical protein
MSFYCHDLAETDYPDDGRLESLLPQFVKENEQVNEHDGHLGTRY